MSLKAPEGYEYSRKYTVTIRSVTKDLPTASLLQSAIQEKLVTEYPDCSETSVYHKSYEPALVKKETNDGGRW